MPNKEISIYSKSAHIIEHNKVSQLILPDSTDISSIIILDSKNNIIPFTINKDSYFGVGEPIIVIKDGSEYTGTILTVDDKNITILDGVVRRIRNYDYLNTVKSFDSGQKIQINSSTQYTISYLVSNISWNGVGTATVDELKNVIHLHISANINNNLGKDIQGRCKLIAGNVNQYIKPEMKMRAMTQSIQHDEPINGTSLEDYVSYDCGYRNLQKRNMIEFINISLNYSKIYTHITQTGAVNYGYTCKSPIFIPQCNINLYKIKDSKMNSFIGSTHIQETQKNNTINMYIGESTLVECKSVVTSMSNNEKADNNWHITIEDISAKIRNLTKDNIILHIKHYIGTKTIIDNTQCNNYTRTSDGYIEWAFEIKPSTDEQKFECKLTMGESY